MSDYMNTTTNAAQATFAQKSNEYAKARPQYPNALFQWLADRAPRKDVAWDVATGNGQSAVSLAHHFAQVYATDISPEQIAHAITRDNITYMVSMAEKSDFPDAYFDVVTVAQALHWFDFDRFWPEVARVAKPGALFFAWGYDWPTTTPEIDDGLVRPFREIIHPFWAHNNHLLWDGYRTKDIAFPFQRLDVPRFTIEVEWRLSQLVNYMMTWSAYKRSQQDPAAMDAMDAMLAKHAALADANPVIPVTMVLKTVAGRVARS
jgi:SAM-dependent methyltransferase